jgi:hypothetical protein
MNLATFGCATASSLVMTILPVRGTKTKSAANPRSFTQIRSASRILGF